MDTNHYSKLMVKGEATSTCHYKALMTVTLVIRKGGEPNSTGGEKNACEDRVTVDRTFKMFHEGSKESNFFMASLRANLYTNRDELVEKKT